MTNVAVRLYLGILGAACAGVPFWIFYVPTVRALALWVTFALSALATASYLLLPWRADLDSTESVDTGITDDVDASSGPAA